MTDHERPEGRDTVIVAAIVSGSTTAEAAVVAECSAATVTRARRQWRRHIQAEQASRYTAAAHQLLESVPKAVRRLDELVDSDSDSTALAASKSVLDLSAKWQEVAKASYFTDSDDCEFPLTGMDALLDRVY